MDLFNRNYLAYPEKVYKYWKDEKLCDLTLIAELDKTRVSVHRLVLSASTDFFDVLLTSEFKEHHRNEIVVKNISGTTLESVIHFFYTGIIEISSENAESLLAAASFLLSPQLQRKCTEYFERPGIIDASNCIGIWAVASKYAFQKMKAGASEVIYEQFMEVSKNEEFLRLNETYLVELLQNDKMNINSEEDVFNAIVDWVEFGVDERKLLFPKIVRAVRVNLLNEKFMIRHVFTVCKRFGCPSTFHELCDVSNDTNNDPIERVYFSPDLLAINFEKGDIKIEIFSQRLQTWRLLDNIVINKYWFGAELVGNHLYLIGGSSNEDTPVNTVERINLVTQEHKDLQPMLQARWTPSILNTNGYIYVVGGVNRVYLNTAERYEIETNEWTSLASMSIGRTFVATAILSGKLYVMGGRSDNSTFLSSVECYDPTTNAWTHAAPMNSKRAGARGGVISGHLYVVGGLDGFNFLSTIERYDQQKNEWTMINIQLNNARCDFGMVLCQNLVIVAGGSVKDSDGKSCEQLSLLTGQLKYVQPMIAVKECCHLFRFKN